MRLKVMVGYRWWRRRQLSAAVRALVHNATVQALKQCCEAEAQHLFVRRWLRRIQHVMARRAHYYHGHNHQQQAVRPAVAEGEQCLVVEEEHNAAEAAATPEPQPEPESSIDLVPVEEEEDEDEDTSSGSSSSSEGGDSGGNEDLELLASVHCRLTLQRRLVRAWKAVLQRSQHRQQIVRRTSSAAARLALHGIFIGPAIIDSNTLYSL